jgi:serine/threonine protein kinase
MMTPATPLSPLPEPLSPEERGQDPSDLRGSMLGEAYRLDAVLGEGPSGVVYQAWHVAKDRSYAIKVLRPELGALTAALVRLRHDNQAISRLQHPHLSPGCAEVMVLEGGCPLLVRELGPGESLRQRLLRGPMPLPEVCRLFVALCGAIEAAHRHGVVHGDLKPENLLITQDADGAETVQVLDFGMCHLRFGEGGIGSHPILGPVRYLAPEQIQGDEAALDCRVDIFALGAILYECLTGQPAFDGQNTAAVVARICLGEAPRPGALRPELPAALDEVVAMALDRRQEERFTTPRALWAALHGAVAGEEGVVDALLQAAGPSAASSTLALLPGSQQSYLELLPPPSLLAERAAGGAPPGRRPPQLAAPPLGHMPRPWPRKEVRARHPRRRSGPRAIRLYKEMEQALAGDPSAESHRVRRRTAEEAVQVLVQERGAARPAGAGMGGVDEAVHIPPAASPQAEVPLSERLTPAGELAVLVGRWSGGTLPPVLGLVGRETQELPLVQAAPISGQTTAELRAVEGSNAPTRPQPVLSEPLWLRLWPLVCAFLLAIAIALWLI